MLSFVIEVLQGKLSRASAQDATRARLESEWLIRLGHAFR
ncbi:Uncharacterised protein [Mycobacterium tuberculosis]|nr:Uncharacterised protein [Mycobacterium tuberculosis]